MTKLTKPKSGFTLIELLVAMTIFIFLAVAAVQIFFYVLHMQRNINTQKKLQDETRFLIERVVKEYRNGTIDFPEYYIKNVIGEPTYEDYTDLPPDGSVEQYVGTDGDGVENALYIIYPSGNERTVFFLGEKQTDGTGCTQEDIEACICTPDTDDDGIVDKDCDLMMRKEKYIDEGASGDVWKEVNWTWTADNGFTLTEVDNSGEGTEVLNSSLIRIDNLEFYISPPKDPFKFYDDNDVQYHPMVTIYLTTSYIDPSLKTNPVEIQTSVSSRLYHEIEWETPQEE